MPDSKMPKHAAIFICEKCAFKCCKKSNYSTHLMTAKHIKSTKLDTYQQQKCDYTCLCGKVYKESKNRPLYSVKRTTNIGWLNWVELPTLKYPVDPYWELPPIDIFFVFHVED